jgi:hypothetical protein
MLVRSYGLQVDGSIIRLPKNIGEGFAIAYNLPDDLSVIISDTLLYDDLVFHRQATASQHYFILQFNESFTKGDEHVSSESNEHNVYIYARMQCCLQVP